MKYVKTYILITYLHISVFVVCAIFSPSCSILWHCTFFKLFSLVRKGFKSLMLQYDLSPFPAVLCTYLCADPMRYCYSNYTSVLSSLSCLLARQCFFVSSYPYLLCLYGPCRNVTLIQRFSYVFKSTVSRSQYALLLCGFHTMLP